MHRLTFTVAAAVLLTACADRAADPTAPLRPTTASRDLGTPPPPPVAGEGRADFEAFPSSDSELACSASSEFNFSYEYLANNPGNNAYLHVRFNGHGLDIAIHQTNQKIDAKGDVTIDDFSFLIKNVLSGNIIDPAHDVPTSVTLHLTGKLTTDGGTCNANAALVLNLVNTPPPPHTP